MKEKPLERWYVGKKDGVEDLEIPGAELDDANEVIGEEDNYYSLGSDDHNDLEDDA